MNGVTIDGMDNLQRIIRDFPEYGYKKPVMAGFRKAAVPVKAAMISWLPSTLKNLRKAMKASPGKGKDPSMLVGVFAKQGTFRNSRGKTYDPYFIALWHNYGTLNMRANRFHRFKRQVRKTKTPGAAGINAKLFAERGWEKSKHQAQVAFEAGVEKEIIKFLEKNKY